MKGRADKALSHQFLKAGAFEGDQPIPDIVPAMIVDDGKGTTTTAAKGGDPKAGRALAANNGLENMRAPAGGMIGAAAGVQLSAAAGFQLSGGVSAGAAVGFGFGASAGASLSAGIGASVGVGMAAGAGIGLGASAGAGIGFGASAGAGIGFGASAGAGIGFGASAGAAFGASAGAGIGFGASAGASAGFGASAGAGAFAGAGAGFGASAGAGIGFDMTGGASMGASGGGFGISSSMTTSVTGFDGVTRTETQSTFMSPSGTTSSRSVSTSAGSWSAGMTASEGAFMGLGFSKTTAAAPTFDPDRFLGPPAPAIGPFAEFSSSGRLISTGGQVAASYTARESVVIF
jgi:hypothetical protein